MAAPKSATIILTIGGTNYSISHRNFSSLTMERTCKDVCNNFKMNILDDDAYNIEYLLLSGSNDISFSYTDDTTSKKFQGSVIKMSTSFIDNRNMLSLEGFVGISVQDKVDQVSLNWNLVPKFEWSKIFSDAGVYDTIAAGVASTDAEDASWWDNFKSAMTSGFFSSLSGLKMIGAMLSGKMFDTTKAPDVLSEIMNNGEIFTDSAGNFYMYSHKYTEQDKRKKIKAEGSFTVPMKPSEILKLIAQGGNYLSLVQKKFKDYKGTGIYEGSQENLSELDWLYINLWFRNMGKHEGRGWKIGTIANTDLVEEDFTQTNQSYIKYCTETLLNKCKITKTEKETQVTDSKINQEIAKGDLSSTKVQHLTTGEAALTMALSPNNMLTSLLSAWGVKNLSYLYSKMQATKKTTTKQSTYTNFYIYFDGNKTVNLKRLDLTQKNDPKTTYMYYGNKFIDEGHGVLSSFTTNINVLAHMINAEDKGNSDIATTNLITGKQSEFTKTVTGNEDDNSGALTKYTNWGAVNVSQVKANNTSLKTKSALYDEASEEVFKAEATIEGACNLSPQDFIEIIVVPSGESNNGLSGSSGAFRHHSSGKYYIMKISETLDGGRHYCTLDLIKNASKAGTANSQVKTIIKETKYLQKIK